DAPEELVGRPVLKLVVAPQRELLRDRIRRATAGERLGLAELRWVRLAGGRDDVAGASAPTFYGRRGAVQTILREIGDRKGVDAERERLLREAEAARTEAEEANRAKSMFLTNMSHELRT